MIGGAGLLYLFAARAMFAARGETAATFDPNLPLAALGRDYPADILFLLGAVWGIGLGFFMVLTGGAGPGARGGNVARAMLLNALLLVSTLLVAYIGGKNGKDPLVIAVFGLTAAAQIVFGLFLLIFAIFEKPKGVPSLLAGTAVYLVGVGAGVLAFLWGGA